MSRRTTTVVVSGMLLLVLWVAALLMPVPYAELSPGPTYNTLGQQQGKPLIAISGRPTYDHQGSGRLNMVTVSVTSQDARLNALGVLTDWLSDSAQVLPKDAVYPPGKTPSQVDQENAEQMSSSQDNAAVAAAKQLGIPVTDTVVVSSVTKDAPALGKLHAGDTIVAVDGTPVSGAEQVRTLVSRHHPGEMAMFTVRRDGKELQVAVVTGKAPDDPNRAFVGIQPGAGHQYPFTVNFSLRDVGGPSAGMMFALGIIDKLSSQDITGGAFIAGTGTIDDQGRVGPIGGVQMKVIGARRDGATVFLTPRDNCAAAVANAPKGIKLIQVSTLKDAVDALTTLRTGQGSITYCHR